MFRSSTCRPSPVLARLVRRAFLPVLLVGASGIARAQDEGVRAFRYRPDRVQVGRVLHYVKSNIDGTKPEQVALFFADSNRIEVFKYHPGESPAALVIATMDWTTYSAARLESWQIATAGTRRLFATMDYDKRAREVAVTVGDVATPERIAIPRLPLHVYNFDLSTLNVAFAHLFRPEAEFTIGIADPTFKASPIFAYRGDATVRYVGRATRNGKACREYSIDGPGLGGRGGTIWVNAAQDHVEDMEIALPDNPEWTSFKLKLVKVTNETRAGWDAFQRASIASR